jgi:hypothetical protein
MKNISYRVYDPKDTAILEEKFKDVAVDAIILVKFNDHEYKTWLGDRTDTKGMKNKWAETKAMEIHLAGIKKARTTLKTCAVCGKEFEGIKKSKFCSDACKQKDRYKRNKEELKKAKKEKA